MPVTEILFEMLNQFLLTSTVLYPNFAMMRGACNHLVNFLKTQREYPMVHHKVSDLFMGHSFSLSIIASYLNAPGMNVVLVI